MRKNGCKNSPLGQRKCLDLPLGCQVFQGNLAKDFPDLRLHVYPDRMDVAGRITGAIPFADNAPVRYDWSFNRFYDLKQCYLVSRSAQDETSTRSAIRFYESDFAELLENFSQEGRGNVDCCCYVA
jgi:hypothetical protein